MEFSFGNVYLLKNCVISELKFGTVGTADQVRLVFNKSLEFYEKHDVIKKRVWIANRTQKYSVQLVGWIQLRDLAKTYLCGYCVVDDTSFGIMNAILESKFVPINFKAADTLDEAMEWVLDLELQMEHI